MRMRWLAVGFAAALCGFVVHVALSGLIDPIVSRTMQALGEAGHHLTRPQDSKAITILAAVTSLVEQGPAFAIAFLLVARALPERSRLVQATACSALLLGVRGDLMRMPVMNVAIGNPVWIALLQQAGTWLPVLTVCAVLALLMPRAVGQGPYSR